MRAHEGKVLLLLDGEEMNEIAYSSIQLGNRYPLDAIQKIEVIRGPGSASHGGYAELAVVNIVSKKASDQEGVRVSALYGQMRRCCARTSSPTWHPQKSKTH
jgi:outer membrane cobalamin receptor